MERQFECVCEKCGAAFLGRKNQKYCSPRCMRNSNALRYDQKARLRQERKRDEKNRELKKMMARRMMFARDREFAEKFPNLATGAKRGTIPCGSAAAMNTIDVSNWR